MTNHRCEEIQKALIQSQEEHRRLSPEALRHLKECQECRRFAETLAMATAPALPSDLSETTLSACREALRARRKSRSRAALRMWALCACLLVVCTLGVVFMLGERKAPVVVAAVSLPQVETKPAGDKLEGLALDTEFSLANDELSALALELDLLTMDIY